MIWKFERRFCIFAHHLKSNAMSNAYTIEDLNAGVKKAFTANGTEVRVEARTYGLQIAKYPMFYTIGSDYHTHWVTARGTAGIEGHDIQELFKFKPAF